MNNNFVPALPERKPAPANSKMEIVIDAPLTSTQHTEVKTSHTDRAVGFLIATLPMDAALGICVLALTVVGYGVPLLSLPALLIFFLSFTASFVVCYCYTLTMSPEGVAFYEAIMKWKLLDREQQKRWESWDRNE